MKFVKTEIPEVIIIEPTVFGDDRGYFLESYNKKAFEENIRSVNFVQDNESKSSKGVLRGLHFQKPPFAQAKLVRCIEGEVLDVAVDIRRDSPTYGKHVAVELSGENKRQLFIPRGFAHGFSVLSESAVFAYDGQLGSEIKDLASSYKNFNFFFSDLPALDICNSNQLDVFFTENKINTVINCAAYTAVDKAEEDEIIAEKVNSKGVLNLVNAVAKVQGKLIHISTDYVFDGNSFLPYQESAEVNPIGVYGNTKRSGELAVIKADIDGIVIRTSWLYSAYGNNFVKTMLRLGNERDELGVIFDQVGTPTYASDLAKTCLDILEYNSS